MNDEQTLRDFVCAHSGTCGTSPTLLPRELRRLAAAVIRRCGSHRGLEPADAIALLSERLLLAARRAHQAGTAPLADLLLMDLTHLRAALKVRMRQAVLDTLDDRRLHKTLRKHVQRALATGTVSPVDVDTEDPSSLEEGGRLSAAKVRAAVAHLLVRGEAHNVDTLTRELDAQHCSWLQADYAHSLEPEEVSEAEQLAGDLRRTLTPDELEVLAIRAREGLKGVARHQGCAISSAWKQLQRIEPRLADALRQSEATFAEAVRALDLLTAA